MRLCIKMIVLVILIFSVEGCQSTPLTTSPKIGTGQIVTTEQQLKVDHAQISQQKTDSDFTIKREKESIIFFARQKDYPPERALEIIIMSYPGISVAICPECRYVSGGVVYIFAETQRIPATIPSNPHPPVPLPPSNIIKVV